MQIFLSMRDSKGDGGYVYVEIVWKVISSGWNYCTLRFAPGSKGALERGSKGGRSHPCVSWNIGFNGSS